MVWELELSLVHFSPEEASLKMMKLYHLENEGDKGVIAMNTESVCGAISVNPDSEILMITKAGQTVRCEVQNIRETSRGSKGVKLVNLADKDASCWCF